MIGRLGARGLLSLLFHGPKAIDVVETSLQMGLLERLDAGPVRLSDLAASTKADPGRLYKLLDCLVSLGLVESTQDTDDLSDTTYRSTEPLSDAATLVLGPESIERDRDRYAWRKMHGHLVEVVRGDRGVTEEDFAWPPRTPEQVAGFERSMAAGMPPIVESFSLYLHDVLAQLPLRDEVRWLDVGGGDGSLAKSLVHLCPLARVDVLNLPATETLVRRRLDESAHRSRLSFVPGDFSSEDLPGGYDVVSFVRVLHDWPTPFARELVRKAHRALPPGGLLVVCEEFRNAERLAVQFFWTYFLIGVDSCVSHLRSKEHYRRLLTQEGFEPPVEFSGPFDLLVARRI